MNKFIEQKIIELQNSKTATEITQNAKYFINILAENERLTKQLENAVVLPLKFWVGNTRYRISQYSEQWTVAYREFEAQEAEIIKKAEAEARLKELEGENDRD